MGDTRINPTPPPPEAYNYLNRRPFFPIDMTNRAPAVPDTNDWTQLGQALSQVNPKLQGMITQFQDQTKENEVAAGRAASMQSALSWKDAVDQGRVDPGASPWFQKGYNEIYGANQGDAFFAKLQDQVQQNGLLNQNDPQALHQYIAQQAQTAMQGMNPDMQAGFMPKVMQAHSTMDSLLRKTTADNNWNGMIEQSGRMISNAIDQYKQNQRMTGSQFNAQDLSMTLNNLMSTPQFAGLDPKTSDGVIRDAIVSYAVQNNDKSLLQLGQADRPDRKNPGSTVPGFATSLAAQTQFFNAAKTIDANITAQQNQERLAEEQAEKQELKGINGKLALQAYSGQNLDPAMVQRAAQLGDTKFLELQRALRTNQRDQDPADQAKVLNRIYSGDTDGLSRVDALTQALTNHTLRVQAGEEKGLFDKMTDMDANGVDKVPLVRMLNEQLLKNGDPNTTGIKLFKNPDAPARVAAQFLEEANTIVKQNPGVPTDQLSSKFRKAYDDVMEWNRKAFPADIQIGNEKPSNVSATPASNPAPAKTTTAPSEDDIKWLKSHANDPKTVARFKSTFGIEAYNEALNPTP